VGWGRPDQAVLQVEIALRFGDWPLHCNGQHRGIQTLHFIRLSSGAIPSISGAFNSKNTLEAQGKTTSQSLHGRVSPTPVSDTLASLPRYVLENRLFLSPHHLNPASQTVTKSWTHRPWNTNFKKRSMFPFWLFARNV
jgi:hypothetical protein